MPTQHQDTLAPQIQNRLIRHLPVVEQADLLSQAELVQLNFADLLCKPGESYQYVYFPLTAFISLSCFKLPKKRSTTALSQHAPTSPMLARIP